MPLASERERTADRLADFPGSRARRRGPGCSCGSCPACFDRLRQRVYATGERLGPWRSERARAALHARLHGEAWASIAARLGYASAHSAAQSAKYVADDVERIGLRVVARRERREAAPRAVR